MNRPQRERDEKSTRQLQHSFGLGLGGRLMEMPRDFAPWLPGAHRAAVDGRTRWRVVCVRACTDVGRCTCGIAPPPPCDVRSSCAYFAEKYCCRDRMCASLFEARLRLLTSAKIMEWVPVICERRTEE